MATTTKISFEFGDLTVNFDGADNSVEVLRDTNVIVGSGYYDSIDGLSGELDCFDGDDMAEVEDELAIRIERSAIRSERIRSDEEVVELADMAAESR